MSTDALAAAQLELLYRLGVLERDAPTPRHVQQQQHSTVSRPSIGSSRRRRTNSGNDGDPNSLLSDSMKHPLVHPLRQDPFDTSMTRRPPDAYHSSKGIGSHYEQQTFLSLKPTRRERSRTWFLQWKLFVRAVHERRNVSAIWCFRVKKRAWSALMSWCDRRRRWRLLAQVLQEQWKGRRTIRTWLLWTSKRLRLRLLQEDTRFSFINRLRRHRMWVRWQQFASRKLRWRVILEARQQVRSTRFIRVAWNELKAFVCTRRQRRRNLTKCLLALKANVELAEVKRIRLHQARTMMNKNATKRLLRAWRQVARLKVMTCRIKCRTALEISRKRYFRIWRRCLRDNYRIAEFRAGRRMRLLRCHILAWLNASKALAMARGKYVGMYRTTRELYFQAWRRETELILRYHNAVHEINLLRQIKALRILQSWTLERRNQHERLNVWRLHALEKFWRNGLLAFHRARQATKAEAKRLDLDLQRTFFAKWVRLWRSKAAYRAAMHNASLFALRTLQKHYFSRLEAHRRVKANSKQELARGEEYYRFRLLQRGVDELAHLVAQRSEQSRQSLRIRRQARIMVRARCFGAWNRWMHKKQAHARAITAFRERKAFKYSWFNPSRRGWDAWRAFTVANAQRKSMAAVCNRNVMKNVMRHWHHRARLQSAVAMYEHEQCRKMMKISFSKWRSRVSHWQGVREVLALAQAVYRRKKCGQVMCAWKQWTREITKVKLRQYRLERATSLRTLAISFHYWRVRLRQRTRIGRLWRARDAHWKAKCLNEWREFARKRVRLRRKLVHYRQVFGRYPTTSLVRGCWLQWSQCTQVSRGVRSLRSRKRRRMLRARWRHWALFHLHNLLFREWRQIAVHSAAATHHFGQRLRLFYTSTKGRLKSRTLSEWRALCARKKFEREALLRAKRDLLQAIVTRHTQLSLAKTKYARKWFSRWRREVNIQELAAMRYYKTKLSRKLLVAWWRFMVNAKQELVLSEAKQVLGGLSFYHPHQQLYTRIVKEKARSLRATAKADRSEARMKKMRRMLDPETARTYLNPTVPDRDITRRRKTDYSSRVDIERQCERHQQVAHSLVSEQNENDSKNSLSGEETSCTNNSAMSKSRKKMVSGKRASRVLTPNSSSPDAHGFEHTCQSTSIAKASTSKRGDCPVVVQELPLFDSSSPVWKELRETSTLDSKQECDITVLQQEGAHIEVEHRVSDRSNISFSMVDDTGSVQVRPCAIQPGSGVAQEQLQIDERKNSFVSHPVVYSDLSLSQLASMELLAPPPTPALQVESHAIRGVHFDHRRQSSKVDVSRNPVSTQSTQKRGKETLQQLRISVTSPSPSLSAILDISKESKVAPTLASTKPTIAKSAQPSHISKPAILSVSDILQDVLAHYSKHLVEAAVQCKNVEDIKAGHKRVCFVMLRDLGLFHNQFYVSQMQRAMESIGLDQILFAHERLSVSDTSDEREYLQEVEAEFLKQFLNNVIEGHPLFDIAALKRERCSQDAPTSPSSLVDESTLQWLVIVHLRPWVSVRSSISRTEKPFWIKSTLPIEVETGLEKLVLCINKYFKVLVQLYSTRVDGSRLRQRTNDCRQLSKSEFTQLLKYVHVFPQLLTRREVECAFDAACCSRPDQKEINFPEFIEALVRCSCCLQWGDNGANDASLSETGVVVRFLMLLFAMEGRGTVLQKRNEDLQVVVGFLEQQQAQSKAAKLHRFRSLLADQIHNGTGVSTSSFTVSGRQHQRQNRQAKRSGWRRSIELVSPQNKHSSPRRSREPDLFFFDGAKDTKQSITLDDSAELLDVGLRGGFSLNEASGMVFEGSIELASPIESLTGRYPYSPPPVSSNERYESGVRALLQRTLSSPVNSDVAEGSFPLASREGEADYKLLERECHRIGADHAPGYEMQPMLVPTAGDFWKTPTDAHSTPSKATYHIGELRDGDSFVREMLDSIGDAELLLHQSNLQLKSLVCQEVSHENIKFVNEYSDDFELESGENLPTRVMRSLFASGNSLVHMELEMSRGEDDAWLSEKVEDTRVDDPMLNQLTHIERFADSSDWMTSPTLEDIAELGVYAASPAPLHQITPIDDATLDELTDPIDRSSHADEV